MPKGVGASTQPCFTPLLIGKGSEVEPTYDSDKTVEYNI